MSELKPTLLLILDGLGLGDENYRNAVYMAKTPNLDQLMAGYPYSILECTGQAVGLPKGQMGNSEVGHLNIGAGRIVDQDIVRIDKSIEDGTFYENKVLNELINRIKSNRGRLHLMGLVSDGGVHSHQEHIYTLLKLAAFKGLKEVYIHAFLDGRDTPPDSGYNYIRQLQNKIQELGIGRIVTVSGRYYAMDRDKRWERIKLAYQAIVCGQGIRCSDALQCVRDAYDRGETDEFVQPSVIVEQDNQTPELINQGDGVFFINFRADRARQLVQSLFQEDFAEFERKKFPKLSGLVTMTQYDKNFPLAVAFPPLYLKNVLGEVCSAENIPQLRIAETEKYAHVTYFFNGGEEEPFEKEDRILIPSPKEVKTYDQKPEMSAFEVTSRLLDKWAAKEYGFLVCNLANLDMVGHTGNFEATVRACQAVDECLGQIWQAVLRIGGRLLLTADHGNADSMLDEQDNIQTAHSHNPVPLVWIEEKGPEGRLKKSGKLGDIGPTILGLWNLSQPIEMTGHCLIDKGVS